MHHKSKLISALLTLAMLLSLLPLAAISTLAASAAAQVGNTYYDTLEEAVAAIQNGDTIIFMVSSIGCFFCRGCSFII